MKVKDLLAMLNREALDKEIFISSDEEMNCLYGKGEIVDIGNNRLAIIGYSGSEIEL